MGVISAFRHPFNYGGKNIVLFFMEVMFQKKGASLKTPLIYKSLHRLIHHAPHAQSVCFGGGGFSNKIAEIRQVEIVCVLT